MARAICPARSLTSAAAAAKPRPVPPLRAAWIDALRAIRLVCPAMAASRPVTSSPPAAPGSGAAAPVVWCRRRVSPSSKTRIAAAIAPASSPDSVRAGTASERQPSGRFSVAAAPTAGPDGPMAPQGRMDTLSFDIDRSLLGSAAPCGVKDNVGLIGREPRRIPAWRPCGAMLTNKSADPARRHETLQSRGSATKLIQRPRTPP